MLRKGIKMMQVNESLLKAMAPLLQVLVFRVLPFMVKTPTQFISKARKTILKLLGALI